MKKILISIIALFSVLPLFADETLYLNTGGDVLWNQGGAKFAIYYFNSTDDNGWSDLMTVENGNIFKGQIPEDYAYVVFARLSSSATAGDWNKVWNKTDNLSLGADNLYTITGWGGETDSGEWSTYTPVTEPTITDIEVSGRKMAGQELTFTAMFAGFSGEPTVVYQINGEEQPGNTFTPPSASVYTVRAEATYGDDEYAEKEIDLLVQEKPEDITVKLLASSAAEKSWSEVAIYAKDDLGELTPAWPGTKLEESGGWYSYTISNAGDGLYIVFNNNIQFGEQTVDTSIDESADYELSGTNSPYYLKEYEPVVTYDTTMYVAGTFTNWQAGMQELPYTINLPAEEELEFKQVRQIIKKQDGTPIDTTLTWYGQKNEGAYMTRESSAWKLNGENSVLLLTDEAGDYTFSLVGETFTVTWPEKLVKIYAKNNWDCGEWAWIEMVKGEGTIYTLENVVFGGTGVNINNKESDGGAFWYDLKVMKYASAADSIKAKDTVKFVFDLADGTLTATLIGRPVPVTVTVGTSGYATIVTLNDLTVPSGVQVYGYTFDDLSGFMVPGDTIKAGETLPSGKGYVVKAAQGSYTFEVASAAAGTTAKFASDLTGWTYVKAIGEVKGTVYGLGIVEGKVGFYKFSGATIPAGKAVYVKSN